MIKVTVVGVSTLRADLRRFAPDLNKQLDGVLRGQATMVAKAARELIPAGPPLSGWARAWQGDTLRWSTGRAARAGIRASTARGRVNADGFTKVVAVIQNDSAGSVYEFASGGRFGRALTARHGKPGRALWRATDTLRPQVEATVTAAVTDAEHKLAQRIASGGA